MSDQRGFTLIELLVSIGTFVVLLSAIMMITEVSIHSHDRIAKRVAVNQRARPVMTRIIDELHSACVAPRIAPVRQNSTGNAIIFWSKFGFPGDSAAQKVQPTPNEHRITLSGTTLTERIYSANPGSVAPNWSFATSPTVTRTLLTNVSAPPGGQLFRYYAYEGGQVSATPLATPLDEDRAAIAVQVDVAFRTSPAGGSSDANAPITLTDSAILRLEAAAPSASEVNVPCA